MGNRVGASQQVQDSPNDQVFKTRYKHRDTTKWILEDINANACLCNEESDEKNVCHCGKNQDKHVCNAEKQQHKSVTESTNYFGQITFGRNYTAKYIRVRSNTTTPKTVLKLMKEHWKLEIPTLLISVHGSMKSFKNDIFAKTCQTSLTKAVQGTGTWIITDGKHEYVNTDETPDKQPIIIGISQWGAIHNTHQMDTQQGTSPAKSYTEKNSLDPHHNLFILIDDGSGDTSSTTRKFREELESEITNIESDNGVPIVLLVVQGDDDINRTVYEPSEKKLPVVIVQTSDKKACGTEGQPDIPKDDPTSKFTHICEWKGNSCESELGLAIVQVLSKAATNKLPGKMDEKTCHLYPLKLADAWNMFGFDKKVSIDTRRQDELLSSCMMAAILLDEVDYVKQILDTDFDLKMFLTDKILKKLYKHSEGPFFSEALKHMRKQKDNEETNVKERVIWLLDQLRESKPQLRYYDMVVMDKTKPPKTTSAEKRCVCLPILCCKCTKNKTSSDTTEKIQSVCKHPCLELFVWSVLNNRQDMAKLFLERREDAMAAALFAHALLSAMSDEIDDKDFKETCEKNSSEFTTLAIGILKQSYKESGVQMAKKLLIQKQRQWEDTSCVMIAVNAKNMRFISDHACQNVFNNIWMGDIEQDPSMLRNNLKLLLCIFVPFLIVCLVSFKKKHQTCIDPKTSIGRKVVLNKFIMTYKTDNGSNSNPEHKPTTKSSTGSSEQGIISSFFGQEPAICKKLKYFYEAPVIKCFHNVISYMIFLALYSYSLMSKVNRYLSWQEILLCVWVFTIFTHELMQIWSTSSKGMKSKLYNYIKDGWNIIDIVTVFLFLIGMILRIFDHPQIADSALVVHGVNLITFYLRLLHIFSVHRELGPKLVMIIQMVKNMAYFFMILVVFIVAYGIASHSILYPHTEPSFETFTEIFRRPYWNIYGELMLDTIEGSPDCTNDPALYNSGSYSRCPTEAGKYFVPLLLGAYMLMCNILLLNLLIAMFSFTFQNVQEKSNLYWSFQQYSLINEYASRPVLVPPVIILSHLCQLIVFIVATICKVKPCEDNAATKNAFCVTYVLCSEKEKKIKKCYKNRITMRLEHIFSNVSEADSANLEKRMEQMEKQLNCLVQKQSEILEKLKSSKVLSR